jgi:hypothetical protein
MPLLIARLKKGDRALKQYLKLTYMKSIANSLTLVAVILSITYSFASSFDDSSMAIGYSIDPKKNVEIISLSAVEVSSLNLMREEEKLARDVYTFLYTKWNLHIFVNIGESEQRHMDAVLQLLTKYNLPDPVGSNNAGKFSNTRLQELYNQLTVQGSTSLADALKVGATIEDLDIFDLETALTKIQSQDIRTVYENLNRGSRNHLRAFYSNLVSRGEMYAPQYISQTEFDSILSRSKEKGGQHMKHKN